MSFDLPNLNKPQNKAEKESVTNAFLREQIRLPEEKWSPEFRKLVDDEARESVLFMERRQRIGNGEEVEVEESPDAKYEHTFRRYLEQLGLREEELKGKRIMDLGAGDGEFIKYLVSKGITSEAYGIDINPDEDFLEQGFENHLFKGSSEEDLPVQGLDYIVASRAIWHDWKDRNGHAMNVEIVLEKSLSALNEKGEMRIYPIEEDAKRNLDNNGYAAEQQKKWDALLPVIAEKYGMKYEIEPRNIFVNAGNGDVTLQSVLILRK